ncbi:MAG: hypothetical protein K2G63_03435 [Oscillospiraceae bacterium]|nr:hypothetical protein [Oscillospiraceae bacterium]
MATDNFARFMALQALDNSNSDSGSSDTLNNAGKIVTGKVYTVDGTQYTAKTGAEIFNDYENNKAIGEYSHAGGYMTAAENNYAYAYGCKAHATGLYSYSIGCLTVASGMNSYALGNNTLASGNYSHAQGELTKAIGRTSYSEGCGTSAKGNYSHVMGKFNVEDNENKFAFIIGNGTSSSKRSNALAIGWDGYIYVGNSKSPVNVLGLMNRLSALEAKVSELEGGANV